MIADLCDIFYIGGTKVGALCGEALIFSHKNAPRHFLTLIKQHGALMAKGRLVGIQFFYMFSDFLFFIIICLGLVCSLLSIMRFIRTQDWQNTLLMIRLSLVHL